MTPPVDPNEPLMTGENSFIRLSHDGGQTPSDRVSHWRVLWCAAGAGHALFVQSELTEGKVRIYGDNAAVALAAADHRDAALSRVRRRGPARHQR